MANKAIHVEGPWEANFDSTPAKQLYDGLRRYRPSLPLLGGIIACSKSEYSQYSDHLNMWYHSTNSHEEGKASITFADNVTILIQWRRKNVAHGGDPGILAITIVNVTPGIEQCIPLKFLHNNVITIDNPNPPAIPRSPFSVS